MNSPEPYPVDVIRHPRERISKCSLRHLHERPGFRFFRADDGFSFEAEDHLLLEIDAPPITEADRGRPILLLDSTWKLLPRLRNKVQGRYHLRSLPRVLTAYPRIGKAYPDPFGGLASVEALHLALKLLGVESPGVLEGYHWSETFLEKLPPELR